MVAWSPNMVIGAICDILPEKKEKADAYGVPFYADYKEMIASGDVDAVVTTVPHYLHPEMGIYGLEHGMHTLLEKPVGVYTKQAREVIEFAETKPDLKFGVFFNQRTNPLYKDLKALMESGELGALRHTSWIITTWWRPQGYYDQSEWRATWGGEGGGVLVNQAPHQLDLWQWMCGVPKSVFAKVPVRVPPRHRGRGRGQRARRLRRRRHRHLHHLHARHDRHRPPRDPVRQGQDRRRELQQGDDHPPVRAEQELSQNMGMEAVAQAVHRSARHRRADERPRPRTTARCGASSTPTC